MNHPLLSCPDQTTNTSAHDSSMVTIQDYQLYIIIFNGKNICCTRGLHKLLIYLFKWEKTFDISACYTNFNYSKRISVFEFRFSYAYVPSDLIELLMTVTDCSHCSANSERWQSLSNHQLLTLLDFFSDSIITDFPTCVCSIGFWDDVLTSALSACFPKSLACRTRFKKVITVLGS
jgi:hypothetical protein